MFLSINLLLTNLFWFSLINLLKYIFIFSAGSSSSSSTCSTPNDHSLARGIFDINTVLISFGLGRFIPPQTNLSTPSSTRTTPKTPNSSNHQTILRSTSQIKPKENSSPSASANTTPSPVPKKQHKRTCSSPITNTSIQTNGYRARPCYSPVRPNSLILNPIMPPPPRMTKNRHSEPQLVGSYFNHPKKSTKITSTPEEDEQTTDDDVDYNDDQFYSAQSSKLSTPMVPPLNSSSNISNSQLQLNLSCILDIDTDEQIKHQTDILPPETDGKNNKDTT